MSALTFETLSTELTQALRMQTGTPPETTARCTLGRDKVMVLVEYPLDSASAEPMATETLDWLEKFLREQFDNKGLPDTAVDLAEGGTEAPVQLFLKHVSEPKPFTMRSFIWKVDDGFDDLFGSADAALQGSVSGFYDRQEGSRQEGSCQEGSRQEGSRQEDSSRKEGNGSYAQPVFQRANGSRQAVVLSADSALSESIQSSPQPILSSESELDSLSPDSLSSDSLDPASYADVDEPIPVELEDDHLPLELDPEPDFESELGISSAEAAVSRSDADNPHIAPDISSDIEASLEDELIIASPLSFGSDLSSDLSSELSKELALEDDLAAGLEADLSAELSDGIASEGFAVDESTEFSLPGEAPDLGSEEFSLPTLELPGAKVPDIEPADADFFNLESGLASGSGFAGPVALDSMSSDLMSSDLMASDASFELDAGDRDGENESLLEEADSAEADEPEATGEFGAEALNESAIEISDTEAIVTDALSVETLELSEAPEPSEESEPSEAPKTSEAPESPEAPETPEYLEESAALEEPDLDASSWNEAEQGVADSEVSALYEEEHYEEEDPHEEEFHEEEFHGEEHYEEALSESDEDDVEGTHPETAHPEPTLPELPPPAASLAFEADADDSDLTSSDGLERDESDNEAETHDSDIREYDPDAYEREYEELDEQETEEEEFYYLEEEEAEEEEIFEDVAAIDETEVQRQRELWQQQSKKNPWIFVGAAGFALVGAIAFVATRPCTVGSCDRIQVAQTTTEEAIRDLRTDDSLDSVLATKKQIKRSVGMLSPIPVWSPHYRQAQSDLPYYKGQIQALDLVADAQGKAYRAALASQNPPHPVAQWQSIANDWLAAAEALKAVPSDSPVRELADRKLAEYRTNRATILVRIDAEAEAEVGLRQAQNNASLGTKQLESATSAEDWETALASWEAAVDNLSLIPKGTNAYAEAQKLLPEYLEKLDEVRIRATQEISANESLIEAKQLAAAAQRTEAEAQWSASVDNWRRAYSELQAVPEGTLAHAEAKALIRLYASELSEAESTVQVALRFQSIEPNFFAACGVTATQTCTYSVQGGKIRMDLFEGYDSVIDQSITPPDQRSASNISDDGTLQVISPQFVGSGNQLLKNITFLGTQAQAPIELYDAKGELMATYRPDLEGFTR